MIPRPVSICLTIMKVIGKEYMAWSHLKPFAFFQVCCISCPYFILYVGPRLVDPSSMLVCLFQEDIHTFWINSEKSTYTNRWTTQLIVLFIYNKSHFSVPFMLSSVQLCLRGCGHPLYSSLSFMSTYLTYAHVLWTFFQGRGGVGWWFSTAISDQH